MPHLLVVTFTGPDRPGIVEKLSSLVARHGGNWEESRMASLAGRFAGILKVTIPEAETETLIAALGQLEADGMAVLIDRGTSVPPRKDCRHLQLVLTGADHEGIVAEVSRVLAARNINIDELMTERFIAPMSGEPLFRADARLECPPSLSIDELQEALERLAQDLVVTIDLFPTDEEDG